MKSEERHRLQTNELGQVVQETGRRLENHATTIVAVICGVLVVAAAVTWWSRQSSATSVAAWTLLESAQNVDDFGTVADKYKGSPAGQWARLRESELNLQSGLSFLFSDRELALADLKRAREGFEQLQAEQAADPMIRERTLWGLARCLEAASDGDTAKAVETYQKLLNEVPETIYKPLAEQRISTLKTGGAKEFYSWFSKQNPKPAEIRPRDGANSDDMETLLPSPGKSEFNLNPGEKKPEAESSSEGVKESVTTPEKVDAAAPTPESKQDASPDATKPEKSGEDSSAEKPKVDETKAPDVDVPSEKKN